MKCINIQMALGLEKKRMDVDRGLQQLAPVKSVENRLVCR